MFNITKPTGARTYIAQNQKSGGSAAPAFTDIRTAGFLTDRMQCLTAHQALQILIILAIGRSHPDPVWTPNGCGINHLWIYAISGRICRHLNLQRELYSCTPVTETNQSETKKEAGISFNK
jgi:hypothetical protein